jgi:hypothetical protein
MSTQPIFQIPKEHVPQIREYYLNRRVLLRTELAEVDSLLLQLGIQAEEAAPMMNGQISLLPDNGNPSGYNPRWNLIKKAKFAIKNAGRPLTSKEIVEFIINNYDKPLNTQRKKFMSSMSGTLSNKSKAGGVFKRTQNDADEYEYDIA